MRNERAIISGRARVELVNNHRDEYTAIYRRLCLEAGLKVSKSKEQRIADIKAQLEKLEGK